MKIYSSLNAELTIQNFGSQWLGIIRGTPKDVTLLHNALYNWKATETKWPESHDKDGGIITFWMTPKSLQTGLENILNNSTKTESRGEAANRETAKTMVAHIKLYAETFFDMGEKRRRVMPIFSCGGQITAEKPDVDMKDAILQNAFGTETAQERGVQNDDTDGKTSLVSITKESEENA